MQHYESLLKSLGYISFGYGFHKITENYTHWITLFEDTIQMYGYNTKYGDDYSCEYDTGTIKITSNQLEQLIEIFTTNHN